MQYIFIFLFGLIIGSFVNVVIYRLPRGRTFIKGRSQCPGCGGEIVWYDLIPVLSFLFLKFRCRRCGFKISWAYPAVELYSGVVFMLSFRIFSGAGLIAFLFYTCVLESLLILIIIDLQHLILPDSVLLFILAATVIYGALEIFAMRSAAVSILSLDNLMAALAAFSLFFLIWFLSKGKWMGLGDAKFAGLIGIVFGGIGSLIILYLAIILGAIVGLVLFFFKKATLKTKLPLGSFIGVSASIYVLFGPILLDKLNNLFRFVIPLFKLYN